MKKVNANTMRAQIDRPYLCDILYCLCSLLLISCSSDHQRSPNIILILADDMGYSDLGCTGSEIETPNLDALAEQGVLFTHCYNTSRCCPTRASLLTGLYQHEVGYGHMDSDLGLPSYQGRFRDGITTLPQAMQAHGYRSIMVGKWHLGHEAEHAPLARGFDQMYGIPKGGGVYFYPCVGRDRQVYLNEQEVVPDSDWYSTDAFTDYAIEFAEEAIDDQQPFFMYLAYIAPHFPLQARDEDIKKYSGSYSKGYAFYREARFNRQKSLGVTSSTTTISPAEYGNWDLVEDKAKEDLKMAVYAAQVDRLDQNIGRLVESLRTNDELDNTMIIFLSDNGAASTNLDKFPEATVGTRDCWSAFGKSWGNVSNTPYRKYKAETHEGGIITPLIIHWPEKISTSGMLIHDPVHIIDLFPTMLAIAAQKPPENSFDKNVEQGDAINLMSLLGEESATLDRALFFEHQGNRAARVGDWKLVGSHQEPWELYNLTSDPTELNNVSDQYPAKELELIEKYDAWASANGVMEWPIALSNATSKQ